MERSDHKTPIHTCHAGLTLDVWRFGSGMANSRPIVTRRLDAGATLSFSLKDIYPDITAGDIYAVQLRAYMPFPHTQKAVRVVHSLGQATVHVGHCLLYASTAGSGGAATVAKGSTLLPLGFDDVHLYHLHVALTCAPPLALASWGFRQLFFSPWL